MAAQALGAGTDALRAAIYLPGRSLVGPVLIPGAWAAVGTAAIVIVGHGRRPDPLVELEIEAGVAAM